MQAQGVVTPIDAVVTAATGVKKRSRGQRLFLATVKRSRTISKLGKTVKMQFWMIKFFMVINIRNAKRSSSYSVQRKIPRPRTLAGAAEWGGGKGTTPPGGLAPPKMTDGIYQSETRWQKKYLAYSSEMAIATIYTHSKLAQLTAASNPDSKVASLSNQHVRSSLNYR